MSQFVDNVILHTRFCFTHHICISVIISGLTLSELVNGKGSQKENIYPVLPWCSFIIQISEGLPSCRWKLTLPFFFPPMICLLYLRQKPQKNLKDIISKTWEKNTPHFLWVNLLYIWSCRYLIFYVPGTIYFWTGPPPYTVIQ